MKCNYVGVLYIIHVGVLKVLLEQSSSSVNCQILLEMQSDILLIISCICELDVHRKVSVHVLRSTLGTLDRKYAHPNYSTHFLDAMQCLIWISLLF